MAGDKTNLGVEPRQVLLCLEREGNNLAEPQEVLLQCLAGDGCNNLAEPQEVLLQCLAGDERLMAEPQEVLQR